jgi:hypothetical protein
MHVFIPAKIIENNLKGVRMTQIDQKHGLYSIENGQ